MSYISRSYITGNYYHLFNRGVAKQAIFEDLNDYRALLKSFSYYLDDKVKIRLANAKKSKSIDKELQLEPQQPLIEIAAYCLMPNHFHLLVQQKQDGGIINFVRKSINSYTKYYNEKYHRVGPLFQGTYKAVPVENDLQLLHLSRYIHLNPVVAKIVKNPTDYIWSSCGLYYANKILRLCKPQFILSLLSTSENLYPEFLQDYISYAQDYHLIKELTIDSEI